MVETKPKDKARVSLMETAVQELVALCGLEVESLTHWACNVQIW